MTLFDNPAFEGHEGVHSFYDEPTGLKCIIAVHSTARGPAGGGCRMWPYPDAEAALTDALRLSRAMSYKNAMADIDLGGGKSVIIGDSRTQKTPALFEVFGRCVEALGGRYWGAEDVGVTPQDLAHARTQSRYIVGLDGHPAASGDPSPVTADGVFRGLRLCVQRALGRDLDGITVAIQGVGNVGRHLADRLHAAGAKLVVTDVNEAAVADVVARTGAKAVAPGAIFDAEAEVFAPCALGGAITAETLPRLSAKVIAGGANNQLADADVGRAVFARGMIYAPDYVLNGGGIINVAGEIRALEAGGLFDPSWVEGKITQMTATLAEVLDRSAAEARPTNEVADQIARARLAAAKQARQAAA
ncbi:MAG: Glu/Leu/Phe/Val dehydrogenase dimerization domain-containing protein [Phenylobacterium sp.]|uniref:Glu/Leu/Phe/Val dehydrogenase dimerization domain-containing protein n=1 Tax=Phenylobacterium sp. TaxID=1871053 RepID=UPI002735D150|nr:Glu/Leu/Phe/Val dehydrogenase dimerization domain-containing protein [Phenylobacterium sp.]MDP3172907.1 Glu/Leu/Phe/Val dehydrogenase dimerization domain-containing protein [Phenylobacterium sp.]